MKNYPIYSKSQRIVHWLTALLMLIVIILPLARTSLAPLIGGMGQIFFWHKSLAVVIFLLTIWRFYLLRKQGTPDVMQGLKKLQRIAAKSVQGLLYLILILMPLSGYLMSSRAINFFGLFSIPALSLPASLQQFFHSFHIVVAYLLIVLLAMHMLAALYHHFVQKDNILKSMLPRSWFN